MLSSSDEEFLLLDSVLPKIRKKRIAVHEINRERNVLGEYHHLFPQLKSHADRFYAYTRMSLVTFHYILIKVEQRLKLKHRHPLFKSEWYNNVIDCAFFFF